MSIAETHVTMTELLRETKTVVAEVEDHDVVVERQNKPNLRLSINDRFTGTLANIETASALLRTALLKDSRLSAVLAEAIRETYPWIELLPETDQSECVNDLLKAIATSLQLDQWYVLERELSSWQNTARIWADPELAETLSEPIGAPTDKNVEP